MLSGRPWYSAGGQAVHTRFGGRMCCGDRGCRVALSVEPLASALVVCRSHPRVGAIAPVIEIISTFLDRSSFDHACRGPGVWQIRRMLTLERLADSPDTRDPIIQQWQFVRGLKIAAHAGAMDIIKELSAFYPRSAISARAIGSLIGGESLGVLEWLFDNHPTRIVFRPQALNLALSVGNMWTVAWLHSKLAPEVVSPTFWIDVMKSVATNNSRSSRYQWMASAIGIIEDIVQNGKLDEAAATHSIGVTMQEMVVAGDVAAVVVLATGRPVDLERPVLPQLGAAVQNPAFIKRFGWEGLFLAATKRRHPEIAKLLFNCCVGETVLFMQMDMTARSMLQRAIRNAFRNGDLETIRFLYQKGVWPSEDAVKDAIMHGRAEVIEWMYHESVIVLHLHVDELMVDNVALDHLVVSGFLPMLQCIKLYSKTRIERVSQDCMDTAAANGHLATVQWMYANDWGACSGDAVDLAAGEGHFDVVRWLHAQGCAGSYVAVNNAAGVMRTDIVEWLYANGFMGTSQAIVNATIAGHQTTVQWLYENTGSLPPAATVSQAVDGNRLSVIKWLHDNDLLSRIGENGEILWRFSWSQNFKMIRWLHENTPVVYTDEAMQCFALGGDLKTIQWMHKHRSERVCSLSVTQGAIRSGSLPLVRWLRKHFPEEKYWDPKAVINAIEWGNWHIAAYLRIETGVVLSASELDSLRDYWLPNQSMVKQLDAFGALAKKI